MMARIDPVHVVPAHEQWMAAGGALANFLNAAHLLGFAGKMLSGRKARSRLVADAFCKDGETLVGWIVLGRAGAPGKARPRAVSDTVLTAWPAVGDLGDALAAARRTGSEVA